LHIKGIWIGLHLGWSNILKASMLITLLGSITITFLWVSWMTEIRCPGCGKLFKNLAEVGAKALGLALKATCPKCGARWSVNSLWRKTREVKL
jgi:phage FluMu protein Com